MTNGSLMKVKSIVEWAFCNTFDLHQAIIGLENKFFVFLRATVLDRFYCSVMIIAINNQYNSKNIINNENNIFNLKRVDLVS